MRNVALLPGRGRKALAIRLDEKTDGAAAAAKACLKHRMP